MENGIEALRLEFNELEPKLIEEIADFGTLKIVKTGETVMRTGQHLASAMLILSGSIKVFREGEDGGDFFLYYIHPGQACAMSLTCLKHQETSQVSAIAVEDSLLLFVPMTKVNDWIREYRTWSEFVIHTYRTRFEEALTVIDNVAFRGMDERLEFYLKKQVENCGCNDLQINHQMIANDINSSREVISRLLKKMEQRGLVKLHRNHIEVIDL
jgi:CRP/FNR family transcriptional regulator